MLLGINAHVQNDMPFVLAALGTRTRDGASRKPDHDAVNAVLTEAYQPVVDAIASATTPRSTSPTPQVPVDDIAGLEAVRGWREVVWRNAERLVNAKTDAERAQVAQSIEDYAAAWAQLIAAVPAPTYRAQRDAYCESRARLAVPRGGQRCDGTTIPPSCVAPRTRSSSWFLSPSGSSR